MASKGTADTPTIQSLDRGLAILEAVAEASEPVPLKQLTDIIGIDRSSVFRLANTLRARRFLANPTGSKDYILGPMAWRLSRKYKRAVPGTFFHDFLRALGTKLGETTHLAVLEGNQALFIDAYAPSGQMVTVSGQAGEYVPLYCTAHGKALLADMELPELETLLGKTPLHVYTKTTVVSLPKLVKQLATIRETGFATDDGEYAEELRCVAAPIRDARGGIIASVGISAPITRFPKQRELNAARDVVTTAKDIGASLAG